MAGMAAMESDAVYSKAEQKEGEAPPSMDGAKGENTMTVDTAVTTETSPVVKATPVVPVRRDFRETDLVDEASSSISSQNKCRTLNCLDGPKISRISFISGPKMERVA